MSTTSIILDIIGRDKASKAVGGAARSMDDLGKKSNTMGKMAAAGLAAAGAAAVAFGKSSVDKFQQVSTETMRLRRFMGGTAEEASRMRFAAQESGVSFDTLSKSVQLLSKHTAVGDKAMAAAGVSFRDANGKMRPTGDVIKDLSDKFESMPNGPEKSALAMKLFGKSGNAMVPMLNKGSKGIAELERESDKLGNTISEKDTKAVAANIAAKRRWHATIDGVQIMLGRKLFPALSQVGNVLVAVSGFVSRNSAVMGPLIGVIAAASVALYALIVANRIHALVLKQAAERTLLFTVYSKIAAGASKVWAAGQWLLNAALSANPIGLVVLAIGALIVGLVLAWKHSDTFRRVATVAFGMILLGVGKLLGGFASLLRALGHIPGFGWAKTAADKIDGARSKVDELGRSLLKVPGRRNVSVQTAGYRKAADQLADLRWRAKRIPPSVTIGVMNKLANMPTFAGGVRGFRGGMALVGEEGPELVNLPRGSDVYTASDTAAMTSTPRGLGRGRGGGGGNTYVFNINGAMDAAAIARQIQQMLLELKRRNGGTQLGLT